jgi:predicted transposase YdaD
MSAKGMDFAEIAELVGLSVEQVEQLAKENK